MRRVLCSVVLGACAMSLVLGGSGVASTARLALGSTGPASTAGGVVIPAIPRERAPLAGGTFVSTNWSGYAVTSSKHAISRVNSTFIVPRVSPPPNGFAATWVGIGGFPTTDLIQAGIAEQSTAPKYFPWWERLPSSAVRVPNKPVYPGDEVTVTISQISSNRWTISLADSTRGWNFKKTVSYTSSRSSAEWILEAPQVNGAQTKLPGLRTAVFAPTSTFVTNGTTHTIAQGNPSKILMVTGSPGRREATPSALGANGQSFDDCAWTTTCARP